MARTDFQMVLITGMSGAGRTRAADALEDMGWYVIDNLPPKMLIPLTDMMTSSGSSIHKLCAVVDVRAYGSFQKSFQELVEVLNHCDDLGVSHRMIFLDASDPVLVQRYESVRRPHPLQRGGTRLIDGIRQERALLKPLRRHADLVIDTSNLNVHQLSTRLYETLLGTGARTVAVHIFSFGFKYGMPQDADFVADVRFLPNPFWVPKLRHLTGLDAPVRDYVLNSVGAQEFLDAYTKAILVAINGYAKEDKHFVAIAIGCTGGQHRSVAVSHELADRLRQHGLDVTVAEREFGKNRAEERSMR